MTKSKKVSLYKDNALKPLSRLALRAEQTGEADTRQKVSRRYQRFGNRFGVEWCDFRREARVDCLTFQLPPHKPGPRHRRPNTLTATFYLTNEWLSLFAARIFTPLLWVCQIMFHTIPPLGVRQTIGGMWGSAPLNPVTTVTSWYPMITVSSNWRLSLDLPLSVPRTHSLT